MTSNGHSPSLRRVFVLTVVSFGFDLIPVVCFDQLDYVTHFHRRCLFYVFYCTIGQPYVSTGSSLSLAIPKLNGQNSRT